MATDSESGAPARRGLIAGVIGAELERQAHEGAQRVDVDALAEAIDMALAADEPMAADDDEGKRPDELNATNDD
ncbi:hypothetical protein VW29_00465 [Devosia limi DSM 17137]|nr:hypothetical protein [Devosia limi]KKB86768.1 hypothetical protein VW29_00465 [Devosia limi DSM 17137]